MGCAIENDPRNETLYATLLLLISLLGAAVTLGLSVLLARCLGPDGFQQYVVAVAELSLLATVCEFGVGKYGLKVLPQYFQRGQRELAAGYWRFCLRIVLALSLATLLSVVATEYGVDGVYGNYLLGVAILFLPFSALLAVSCELLMATRAPIAGTVIAKLITPLATAALVVGWLVLRGEIGSREGIVCFGLGGVASLAIAATLFYARLPTAARSHTTQWKTKQWLMDSAGFLIFAFVTLWLFEISVIVLEIAGVAGLEIARYAAASKTGCFILLLAKSCNKYFQPELAARLGRRDWRATAQLTRSRLIVTGTMCAIFLAFVVAFGRELVGWFGTEFEPAYPCLVYVTIGACVATTFSVAPDYLMFSNKITIATLTTVLGGVLLVSLTWKLGSRYGASGAGLALAIVLTLLSLLHAGLSHYYFQGDLQEDAERGNTQR